MLVVCFNFQMSKLGWTYIVAQHQMMRFGKS